MKQNLKEQGLTALAMTCVLAAGILSLYVIFAFVSHVSGNPMNSTHILYFSTIVTLLVVGILFAFLKPEDE
ncbi:hypothetical protein AKJ54_00665 [candidate division MSBL1 archaeon SCGC-AAA382K21]|uniref:Uncharacterized protein n=1 Tax=candidate division MSBL1 archaeon SCGC-AAA382K21 TaxID=1698283 RepID=A0A133VL50_9EURY|nr:hypothetical protein AKJ54_00665 [candidate division MSBL1 archaeon SCGC-AAA382K21]